MRKLWIATAVLSFLLTIGFAALFLREHYMPATKAIASGVRVEINLKTGEVKQAPAAPVVAEIKPAEPPVVSEKETEKKEEPKPDAKAEEAPKDKEIAKKEETKKEHKEETKTEEEKPKEDAKEVHEVKEEPKATKEEPKAKEEHKAKESKVEEPKAEKTEAKESKKAVAEKTKAEPEEKTKKAVVDAPKEGPRIAIVIAGLGLSRSSTEEILKLPAAISFSFSPYASDITQWIKKAGDTHEFYVDLPLEPKDYPQTDPGPYALLTNLDDTKNMERLNQVLKSGTGYHGLISGTDEHFTSTPHNYKWILETMKTKKLVFYYVARPENKQLTQEVENTKATEALGLDLVLDEKLTNAAIDAKLAEAEVLAQKYGYATVLARPYPISAQRIQEWIKTLGPKNIHLVPLSQVKQ